MLVESVQIPRLLTVDEAAEFLGLARNTVYINARGGLIPHYKVGAAVRFDLDELRAWLGENRRGPKVATDG
jgi:excisionase family DNA binding protein